jgi:hypothetical protein
MNTDDIVLAVIDFLNERNLPYMLVGSLATNFYCVPRSTEDGDVVIGSNLTQVARDITRTEKQIRFDPQLSFENRNKLHLFEHVMLSTILHQRIRENVVVRICNALFT